MTGAAQTNPSGQVHSIRRATAADLPSRLGIGRLTLYTNEVMTENLAIYAHLGYRETARRAVGGYRRVFMEKIFAAGEPDRHD